MTTKKTKAKTPAAAPAKAPSKAEILEKWKRFDAKFPNTEPLIFELAQLNRSGFYWQFKSICEQAEALANADCPPDIKQALIDLFENLVYVEKQIDDAKAGAEQAKSERIRELKAELEHAKKNAGEYIDIDKALIMPLSSESLLNDPREFTLAEITAAVYRDFEILRCHQWEIIGIDETNKYHLSKSGGADSDETSFAKRTERIAQNAANPKVKSELLLVRKHASKGEAFKPGKKKKRLQQIADLLENTFLAFKQKNYTDKKARSQVLYESKLEPLRSQIRDALNKRADQPDADRDTLKEHWKAFYPERFQNDKSKAAGSEQGESSKLDSQQPQKE